MTTTTSEIIHTNLKLIDLFIKEEFVKVRFENMSPEEQKAHTKSVADVVMTHVLHSPLEVFSMPVDKFERDKINEEIIEKYLENMSIAAPRRTRPRNPLRHRADGSYNSHCLDPNYAHNYFYENMKDVKIKCDCCGAELLKSNISKHKKSLKCTHVAMCKAHNAKPS